jgi:hypothetical protein
MAEANRQPQLEERWFFLIGGSAPAAFVLLPRLSFAPQRTEEHPRLARDVPVGISFVDASYGPYHMP